MGSWLASGSQERINEADFEIEVTNQSVKVRLNASEKAPRGRFYWGVFFVGLWIAALCLLMFSNGKHGQSGMWRDFATHPVNSQGFIVPLLIVLGVSALMVLISWRYVVMAYPSDETFYCDRSTLTISKVRWLDIRNRDWRTHSYPLDEIRGIKYQAVARAKGRAIYGRLPRLPPSPAEPISRCPRHRPGAGPRICRTPERQLSGASEDRFCGQTGPQEGPTSELRPPR